MNRRTGKNRALPHVPELDLGEESLSAGLAAAFAGISLGNEGLNAKVLVLNKAYAAMRVVSARRAFSLLARDIAEIIHVDTSPTGNGQYLNYNLESWIEISALQREFEPDRHDWVRTVRLEISVPRIIRLLGYDRLPRQKVKFNRTDIEQDGRAD